MYVQWDVMSLDTMSLDTILQVHQLQHKLYGGEAKHFRVLMMFNFSNAKDYIMRERFQLKDQYCILIHKVTWGNFNQGVIPITAVNNEKLAQ